jgi:TRAP-type C4-dicarboxylate transport system substrate-binding protein
MLEELESRSDGRITYETYYGGALGAGEDHYAIVRDGLSDMGYFTATWTPDLFPLTDVLSMPVFVGGKDVAVDIGNAMYDRILYPEFPDVKMIELNGCIQSYLWTKEPVHNLAAAQGLRIRSPGGLQTRLIEALGATPVFLPLGDVYQAIATGTIDGIVTCPPLFLAYHLDEQAKYGTLATFGCVSEGVVMNKDSWENAPEDLKAIIMDVCSNPFRTTGGLTKEVYENELMPAVEEAGVTLYELPEDEADIWYGRFSDEIRGWVTEMEERGLEGKKALLMYKAECDAHDVSFPAFPPEWLGEVEAYR